MSFSYENFSFESHGTHSYLVYTVAKDDVIDSMNLGMLTNNKIHGLAHTQSTQRDLTQYIYYDVSAKIPVSDFLEGTVNKKRLLGVFGGIVDALLAAEDYMIDIQSMILDTKYMFADVTTCETILICMPIVNDDLSVCNLSAFFKDILWRISPDANENCDYYAKIVGYLNSPSAFSLEEFKSLLDALRDNAAPAPMKILTVPQPQVPRVCESAPQPAVPQQPVVSQQPVVTPSQPAPQQPSQKPSVLQSIGYVESSSTQESSASVQEAPEKKITLLNLLRNYSKENLELYKAQRSAKKTEQASASSSQAKQTKTPQPNVGFSIPGQKEASASPSFAFPGQSAPVQPSASKPAPTPAPATPQPAPAPASQPAVNQPVYTPSQMLQMQGANFGETTVLGGAVMGETTVLGTTLVAQNKPHLIRIKNSEKIELNKNLFRIGKERSYVDYFVADNPAISRSHATIHAHDGEYFIVDTNSTNHVYLNGQMIPCNVEAKLTHGMKIRLANEDFEFQMY